MGTNMTEKVRENQHDTQPENVWSNPTSHFNMKYVKYIYECWLRNEK
jgi:hypothetical protein